LLHIKLLFLFARKVFNVKTAGIELGAAATAVGAHGLKRSYKFGAIFLNHALDFVHNGSGRGIGLHAKTAASHKHKLLRVYVHHMGNGGILRRFGAVVIFLAVVSLALHEMRNAYKVTAKMHRNVIGNIHLDAEIQGSYGAMLTHKQLVTPLGSGQFSACFSDGIKCAKLAQHPVFFGGIFQKLNGEIHKYVS
jgi:hypothetical protein